MSYVSIYISKEQWENSPFTKGLKDFNKIKKGINFDLLCFSFDYKIHTYDDMKSHANGKHNIFIDLNELTLICFECKKKYNIQLIKNKLSNEQKTFIQLITERLNKYPKFLTHEEIYEIKYNKLISDFSSGKYNSY